jgi:hypothetical protein
LVNNSIENTDQDDFIPTTQKRFSQVNTTKRKLNNSFNPTTPTTSNVVENKKRTKKSNLFQDVVSVASLNLQSKPTSSSSPPPPWTDLPIGIHFQILYY